MKASYLSDKNILNYIDSLTLRTLFARMKILNQDERVIKTIEGRATGGSVSINVSSSVRRTGSLTLVTDKNSYNKDKDLDSIYKITDVENLISMNKRVEIEIGIKNTGLNYSEYEIFWIPLGQFLITNSSVTHNMQGIQIQVKLTDKMALLNGEISGVIPGALILSPMEDLMTGKKESSSFFSLIYELVSEIGEIPSNKIIIEDIPTRIKTSAFWGSNEKQLIKIIDSNGRSRYEIFDKNKTYSGSLQTYSSGDQIGQINTDFVYPGDKELATNAGDTVESVLNKIAKELGNYEYFFDIDGAFHFREIKNYLNEGSAQDDLTLAIADGYFINTSKGKSQYSFKKGTNLVSSYGNNPAYSQIKNDYTIWGEKKDTKTPIRYHLIIDRKNLTEEELKKVNAKDVWLGTVNGTTRAFLTEQAAQTAILGIQEGAGSGAASVTSTFGRWVFRNTLTKSLFSPLLSKELIFTSNGQTYYGIKLDNTSLYYSSFNESSNTYDWILVYENGSWLSNNYMTINLGSSYVSVLTEFYNWLSANALWQEKFIDSGSWLWNDFESLSQSIEKQTFSFSLANNSFETYTGISVKDGKIIYYRGASETTVFKEGSWINNKYKTIVTDKSQHVSDIFYNFFHAHASVSKKISGRWKFSDEILLPTSDEFILNTAVNLFEPWFETSSFDSKAQFSKLVINSYEIKGVAEDGEQVLYNPTEGWQSLSTDYSWQYLEITDPQGVYISSAAYNWLNSNADQYLPQETSISGDWVIKLQNLSLKPEKAFQTGGFSWAAPCKISNSNATIKDIQTWELVSHTGGAYSLLDLWLTSKEGKAITLCQQQLGEDTDIISIYDQTVQTLNFGINNKVPVPFYNFLTQIAEQQTPAQRMMLLSASTENETSIKAGEIWQLKDNPWNYNPIAIALSSVEASLFNFDNQKEIGDISSIEIKANSLILNSSQVIYESSQWVYNPPIVIKFKEQISDSTFCNSFGAIAKKIAESDVIEVAKKKTLFGVENLDWRIQRYYYYLLTQDTTYLGKEMLEWVPYLFNLDTNSWVPRDIEDYEYFIDMIDLNDVEIAESEDDIGTESINGKKYVSKSSYEALEKACQYSVNNIQRRQKVISSQETNCLFIKKADQTGVFVLNQNDPSVVDPTAANALLEECYRNKQDAILVPKEIFDLITPSASKTAAYDLLRAQLHEFLSYNENINLSTIPVYYLDVNTRISVEDEESDIYGDYIVQSIQIPLATNGQMTINAKRAIERI